MRHRQVPGLGQLGRVVEVVILGVFGGFLSFGFLGLFVGPALLAIAFTLVRAWRVWPDPTAKLARDLSIAESFDEYRDVGTLEFLERLDTSPAFN